MITLIKILVQIPPYFTEWALVRVRKNSCLLFQGIFQLLYYLPESPDTVNYSTTYSGLLQGIFHDMNYLPPSEFMDYSSLIKSTTYPLQNIIPVFWVIHEERNLPACITAERGQQLIITTSYNIYGSWAFIGLLNGADKMRIQMLFGRKRKHHSFTSGLYFVHSFQYNPSLVFYIPHDNIAM